jgi:hypothetical protein
MWRAKPATLFLGFIGIIFSLEFPKYPAIPIMKPIFGVSSPFGAGNTKIFLKARRWRAFKKPIFIMRIASIFKHNCYTTLDRLVFAITKHT